MSRDDMYYCPYSGHWLPADLTSLEHIFPKSLGGSDDFVLRVESQSNCRLGTEVDGGLANDFLMLFPRNRFNATGHSGRTPIPTVRSSSLRESGTPVHVSFDKKALRIWDPRRKETLKGSGQAFTSRVSLDIDIRMRFTAKVALATGYLFYQDLFRQNVRHDDLRKIMNWHAGQPIDPLKTVETRVLDPFHEVPEGQQVDYDMWKVFCRAAGGSCVIVIPGPANVGFIVGVLTEFVGMLNVPANTETFPNDGVWRLGHVALLAGGRLERLSFWEFAHRVSTQLEGTRPPDEGDADA